METWWPVDQGFWWGVVGGGLGTVFGVGGAIVCGYLLPLGRGHRGVLIGMVAVGIGGLLCAAVGVAAIIDGQPYGVYYPLLLIGCATYWGIVFVIPVIDISYRTVLANRPTGTQFEARRWFPAIASLNLLHPMWWCSPALRLRDDWCPQGRYGKSVNRLIAAHVAIGSIILVWGIWRFLIGAGFEEGFPGVFIGGGFLFSAGELWFLKALTVWWSSTRTHEQQRLAAEELRRS